MEQRSLFHADPADAPALELDFQGGTLLLRYPGPLPDLLAVPDCQWDDRVGCYRAPAYRYRDLLVAARRRQIPYLDRARGYARVEFTQRVSRDPFPHQEAALRAWLERGRRGVVVLPTGAGKSYVAILAILETGRSALVVVPTLDLMSQWYATLQAAFDREIGLLGGGYYEVRELTVTTYDSAYLHMERLGHRFGLVIFDECHHLPGPAYAQAAQCCLAPYRLGLTATPEREDGQHVWLDDLIGPIVFRQDIPDLAGEYLAEYEVVSLHVELTAEERAAYARARQDYLQFLREQGIQMDGPQGWGRFIAASCRSAEGRRAFQSYRLQKEIALAAPAKLRLLEALLHRHVQDQVLIFTHDNETVYTISRRFLIPAITHQTPVKERREILASFNQGEYGAIVTSRVLNEGVDLPAANVAVILSGTASVREHVQRLGRILRRREGKRALLYEIVTRGTAEENVSERRRKHHAYR